MAYEAGNDVLLEMTRSIVPPLTNQLYKGLCGRIAVIGGCKEYVLTLYRTCVVNFFWHTYLYFGHWMKVVTSLCMILFILKVLSIFCK